MIKILYKKISNLFINTVLVHLEEFLVPKDNSVALNIIVVENLKILKPARVIKSNKSGKGISSEIL